MRDVATAAVALVVLLVALAAPAQERAGGPVIVDGRTGSAVTQADLVARLAAARFRLLGEVHDNAEHHEIRARLLRDVAATGRRPAVALEVFDLDRAVALRAAQAEGRADAESLAEKGELDRGAWRWPLHRPVIEAALDTGMPIHAANLSRASLRRAMRGGADAETAWAARLAAASWTPGQERALEASIVEGHCGKLPPSAVAPIARAQRQRDAAMAQALVDSATRDGAILLAGNGHVRNDVGVPAYLPEGGHVSVGFVEADADVRTSQGVRAELAANPGYDYVWFTAKAARSDPCERMPDDVGKPK
jgi:uncharacterized iron-regulated protein